MKSKTLFLLLFLFAALFSAWYFLSIYSYHRFFTTHLMGTLWTETKKAELEEILCQPFHFCGQGSTSRAYTSEDGRFVIKTFLEKQSRSKKCRYIPFLRDLANKRRALKAAYKRTLGPINAYQYLPKECGLIFYQFIYPRELFHKSVRLYEKDGSISELDLDQSEYLIQRKAVIVSEYLQAHLVKGDLEKVKGAITKLFLLTKTLYDQGIMLVVLQFLDNFGFIEDEPIRIDVEHLRFDPQWKKANKRHLAKEISKFRSWIVKHAPEEILHYFDSEVESIFL